RKQSLQAERGALRLRERRALVQALGVEKVHTAWQLSVSCHDRPPVGASRAANYRPVYECRVAVYRDRMLRRGRRSTLFRPLVRERQSNSVDAELEARALRRALDLDHDAVLVTHHGDVLAAGGRRARAGCDIVARKVRDVFEVRHLAKRCGPAESQLSDGEAL